MFHPGVQFKAVERDALSTNRDFSQLRTNLDVEAVPVHTEIARRIAEAKESRDDLYYVFSVALHGGTSWRRRR